MNKRLEKNYKAKKREWGNLKILNFWICKINRNFEILKINVIYLNLRKYNYY